MSLLEATRFYTNQPTPWCRSC